VSDISNFINNHTGGGSPAFKFKVLGDFVSGTVTKVDIVERPNLSNPTGEKVKNLVITLDVEGAREAGQTLNEGTRSLWIKPSQQLQALSNALREVGANSVEEGARIRMEWYGEEPTNLSPKKLYRAAYKPGASSSVSMDDLV
jgi:hypothetical protein